MSDGDLRASTLSSVRRAAHAVLHCSQSRSNREKTPRTDKTAPPTRAAVAVCPRIILPMACPTSHRDEMGSVSQWAAIGCRTER